MSHRKQFLKKFNRIITFLKICFLNRSNIFQNQNINNSNALNNRDIDFIEKKIFQKKYYKRQFQRILRDNHCSQFKKFR